MDELIKLRESLKDGKCAFKPLPAADKDALQVVVDEQERNGGNPWGKRKRRSDAGKPKKKRKNLASIVRLNSTDPAPPPSCTSSDQQEAQDDMTHDNMMHDEFNFDNTSDGGTSPEDELPRKLIQKRSLVVAQHSSSISTHITGPAVTPVMGAKTRLRVVDYQNEGSSSWPAGLPVYGSVNHDGKPESGEDELVWDGQEAIEDLTGSIDSFGGGPDNEESEEDG